MARLTVLSTRRFPGDVEDVFDVLESAGFEAYVVGGAVRDLLLGARPVDYDFATNARPSQVMELFLRRGWRVVDVGSRYGVVMVVHPATGKSFEVATYRREVYPLNYRRRIVRVEYANTIEEDLARRDFTINAMAMDRAGGLVDPFGGRQDLRKGIIRFVGEPVERIREDPLRMLRAVRFAAKLGFTIEEETMQAITAKSDKLAHVSRERIGEEVWKALSPSSRAPELLPTLLLTTRMHRVVLPDLALMAETRHPHTHHHHGETVFEHTVEAMTRAKPLKQNEAFMAAVMLHDIGKPFTARHVDGKIVYWGHETIGAKRAYNIVLHLWRRTAQEAAYVSYLVRHHMHPHQIPAERLLPRLIAKHRSKAVPLLLLAYADTGDKHYLELAAEAEKQLRKAKPLLDGHTIMKLYGVPPGPEVGRLKQILYEIQVREAITSPAELVETACRKHGICPKQTH